MTWKDVTVSNTTTTKNTSKFVVPKPLVDSEGGVDFQLTVSADNPWSISSTDPIALQSSSRNDPAY